MNAGPKRRATAQSPCNGVCRIDERSGYCLGCRRTIDEITAWSTLSASQRSAVLDALAHRRPK